MDFSARLMQLYMLVRVILKIKKSKVSDYFITNKATYIFLPIEHLLDQSRPVPG